MIVTNQSNLCQEKDTSWYDQKKFKLEADLTKKVREWLRGEKDIAFTKVSDRYHKGVSDIIACVQGIFVAIELKSEDGKPTPHQLLYIREITSVGGIGGVCYCLADVKDLVQRARERNLKC